MKNFMNSMYALNIVIQSFWSLLMPIGFGILLGWLLTEKLGFENFSKLGYMQMQRNCYTKEDIAKYMGEEFVKYLEG